MIYIDASRYSNTGKKTGVENYSYYLINEMVRQFKNQITLISPRKIDLPVKQIVIPFPRLWTLIRLSWEMMKNRKIDNLFVPSHVLPLIHPKNSVITIHDVVFRYSPKSYSPLSRLYLDWAAKFAVKHAAKIITPSQATKQDLIKFYRADPNKIFVIPLGFAPNPKKEIDSSTILNKHHLEPQKYFLFIGRIEYKKNIDTLIRAFEKLAKKNEEIKLVLIGFPGHGGEKIIGSIPNKLNDRITRTGYISGKEKSVLLKNALCFVFPSRHEGFGLPLLEAMDARVPIIASDIPSSREVAGESIEYFPKEDANALTELMEAVLNRRELSKKESDAYKKIIKMHSWETAAKNTFKILKKG